jgi:hypothetical protein
MEKKSEKIEDMINIGLLLLKCSNDTCMSQKKEIGKNKKLLEKYAKFDSITDNNEKAKVLTELTNNNKVYEYEKCVFNNCKEILKNLINSLKISISSNIPKTNEKYKKINVIINKLNVLFAKKTYTKKDHKEFTIYYSELLSLK